MPRQDAESEPSQGLIHQLNRWFARFAQRTARWAGKPYTFLLAVSVIVVWALSGSFFGFSDTWQLVINTSTTIVTFLMVFLIQNTQNRDSLAVQIKLAELIFAMKGVPDRFGVIENLPDEELERLHADFESYAGRRLRPLGPGTKETEAARRPRPRRRSNGPSRRRRRTANAEG